MDPLVIGSLIGAGAGLIKGLFGASQSHNDWEERKKMQERAWAREDNAVQRRVADLEKAGLSKTLAAGQAAASSSPINLGSRESLAGNLSEGLGGVGSQIIQAVQMKDQLSTSAAERELKGAEALHFQAQTDLTKAKTDLAFLDKARMIAEKEHNYPQLRLYEGAIKQQAADLSNTLLRNKGLVFDNQGKMLDNTRKEWEAKQSKRDFKWSPVKNLGGVFRDVGITAAGLAKAGIF